jgi:hypothetical protein
MSHLSLPSISIEECLELFIKESFELSIKESFDISTLSAYLTASKIVPHASHRTVYTFAPIGARPPWSQLHTRIKLMHQSASHDTRLSLPLDGTSSYLSTRTLCERNSNIDLDQFSLIEMRAR